MSDQERKYWPYNQREWEDRNHVAPERMSFGAKCLVVLFCTVIVFAIIGLITVAVIVYKLIK